MNELKFDYYQEFQILEYLLYPMARISDELIKRLDEKKIYIEISLYAKFVLTAFSMSKLLPCEATPQQNAAADIASVATLGRNLIEIYNFLFYLRLDEVSIEEAELRRLVATYHQAHEQHRIGTKMEVSIEELIKHKEDTLEVIKTKIQSDPFFQNLSGQVKKKILKGDSAVYLTRNEITRRYCRNHQLVDALYKVMSNYVHSGIYGFVTSFAGSTFGCDNKKNRDGIANIVYLVNYYVGLAMTSILLLYPASIQYFPRESDDLLNKLIERF